MLYNAHIEIGEANFKKARGRRLSNKQRQYSHSMTTYYSYLFFDILQLLLKFLDVRVAVVAASVVHQRPFLRCCSGRTTGVGTGGTATAGRKCDLVVHAAAYHVRDDPIDLRPTLDAFLHEGGATITSAHVATRTEQDGRFLVGANDAFFNLPTKMRTRIRSGKMEKWSGVMS